MIVILKHTKLNKDAAKQLALLNHETIHFYPDVNLSPSKQEKDDRLILLDLTADGKFQDSFGESTIFTGIPDSIRDSLFRQKFQDDSELADLIVSWNLPDSVKKIDLYISEVKSNSSRDSLSMIAARLANRLRKHYHKEIAVRVPSHDLYDYTFLYPPIDGRTSWEVYGISASDFKDPLNFSNLLSHPKKELIWRGELFDRWLSSEKQKPTASSLSSSTTLQRIQHIDQCKKEFDKFLSHLPVNNNLFSYIKEQVTKREKSELRQVQLCKRNLFTDKKEGKEPNLYRKRSKSL